MSKFTETEKEQIRQCLLTKGKELFLQYGLAKTSIDDLVGACGIGKGSFYKFFSSKEELFYLVLKKEEEIQNRLIGEHLQEDLPPKEMIVSFFQKAFRLADENPLLQQIFEDGEYERMIRKVPEHLLMDSNQDNQQKGVLFVQALIQRGVLKAEDPEVVVGVLQAVLMLRLHKEKIGQELFPRVMDVIIDCIAEGLTEWK
ncbi:TetR/AcrR family transcriptional regulator [Ammoniphilus resinae]|uniref:AcrR family transcriptional regulator n=1 Tax=Ammoniphilus resinae TaxID=861532 RepID=A0ABS4GPW1_9BACL|nr:TetR/AcrR family transcriptional regulator [Ammoniphilus resinae]MBP1932092.1 AcrR family transcriptional regulator [Ammoniphilus resinae]